jgi:hypothetical protein
MAATMQRLVDQLIAEELRAGNDPAQGNRAGFRICEKLQQPLATFAGVAGYRSLMLRALTLARAEAPLLGGVTVKPDGAIQFPSEMANQLHSNAAAKAGAILACHLLELLAVFIGEALALRLVGEVWPKVVNEHQQTRGEQHEN